MHKTPKIYYFIIALAIAVFFWGLNTYYKKNKSRLITKELNSLFDLSERYKNELIGWLDDRIGDSENILQMPYFRNNITRLITKNNLNDDETYNLYTAFESLRNHLSFKNIILLDADKNIKLSIPSKINLHGEGIKLLNTKNISKPIFSDFHLNKSTDELGIDLFIPIFAPKNNSKLIGLFIAELNPKDVIDKKLMVFHHLRNKTGECIFTKIKDGKILIINELRYIKNKPLGMEIKPLNSGSEFYNFILNKIGNYIGIDYRNKRVLSVVKELSIQNWKIISKIDEEEVLAPLKKEITFLSVLSLSVVFVIGFVLSSIGKKRKTDYYKEKYLVEKDKKESESRILLQATALQASPNAIIITDKNGDIEWCNKTFTTMTGFTFDEILGRRLRELIDIDILDKDHYKEIMEKINTGETWRGQFKNKHKNGTIIFTETSITPFYYEAEDKTKLITIKQDITEKIKARNELLKAKEKAEESDKLKSNFLANMSHELRTPMVGIIGFTEILMEEIEIPELKKYATLINEAGSRLMETLNLILNLTKIEAEKIIIEKSKIDVIKNIKRTISIFDKMSAKKNLYLKFNSSLEKLEIETDERMFDQIITNLVNNAIKYTNEGGVTVYVNKVKNGSYLEIKINDTGIGIPKDKQKLIWEEFRQVSEGISRVYEGTGLGLTITNNFIHKLGGKIKLESKLGNGATFTVLLPIKEKSISTKTGERTFDKTTDIPKIKDSQEDLKELLFVEDDNISSAVVKRFLRGLYQVDLSLNGLEAIEKVKKKKYDGILMDINLQTKMDGTKTAEKIKEIKEYKDVPIIAVTAYAMVGDREKYLKAGFTDYISKPFAKKDIINLLNKTIKKRT